MSERERDQRPQADATGADATEADATEEPPVPDDIPPEAIEEARRWGDLPEQDPEESTGIDV